MTAPRRARALLALGALLGACAGPAAPGRGARAVLGALADPGDVAAAAAAAPDLARARPRDPAARLAAALAARRAADAAAEAAHLAALVEAAPGHPLAWIALRRLSDLAEDAPAVARAVEAGLAPLAPRLAGLAAYRARVARIAAAETLGDHPRVAALRRENGAVTAWTLAGPFGVRRALDFARPTPADDGVLPAEVPHPRGAPPRPARLLPAPDGTVALEGEHGPGDVYVLAADVTLARGGRYLLTLATSLSARVAVDGVAIAERRDFAAHLPAVLHLPVALAPGTHRVAVKVARGGGDRSALFVALAREDGAPSDAAAAPAAPGAPLPAGPRPVPPPGPAHGPEAIAAALAPDLGRPLAAWLAAADAALVDREGGKALLAEAAEALPDSAAVRVTRAALRGTDPTLDEQVGQARAEADLRDALARDPGHLAARIALAALLRGQARLDDAEEVLGPAAAAAPSSPAVALALARLAEARGLVERAEDHVAAALAGGGRCGALELGRDLAGRRRALALEDERARARAECRDGRERLAEHLRRRGDPAGAAAALAPVVLARPWAIEPGLARAGDLVAAGDLPGATEALEALRALWPGSARVEKRLADVRELAGDAAGARAARQRALAADGADLALRRALALEDGGEVLDAWAEDASSAIRAYEAAGRPGDTSSTLVLDAAAIEFHPGGFLTERTHQVVHVRDPRAVDHHGEVSVPSGGELLAVRTLKRDGRSVEPEQTAAGKGSISLAGLEPGDYLRIEYLRALRGDRGGTAADPFFFREDASRLFRSSYVVIAPEDLGVEVDAHGLPAPAPVREGGRVVYRVDAHDVPPRLPEPNQPPQAEVLPWVRAGVGGGREAVHADLADAFAGRARSTVELRAFAARARAAAGPGAGPAERARAAWALVAREILGSGSGFGEEASEVLSRGRGGRLLVLHAVLRELGVPSRVALARTFGTDPAPRRFPTHSGWSHPLLRIDAGGPPIWHDPALRAAPLGTIPSPVLGAEALVLAAPGEPLEVTRTPERAAVEDRSEVTARIVLSADGSAAVEGENRFHGAMAAAGKAAVEQVGRTERRQLLEGILAAAFRGLVVAGAEFGGEGDPAAPLSIRWRGTVPAIARPSNGGLLLDAAVLPERIAARYVQLARRTTPLLLSTGEVIDQRVAIEAPEGFVPEAAPAGAAEGPFGVFTRTERVEGRTLLREERLVLPRGRIPPDRYPEFAAWAAAVDHLQERPATFRRVDAGKQ